MSLLDDFQRVRRDAPCPVCGKPDWCLVSRDSPENPSRVVCARVESPRRWREAGWLHVMRDEGFRRPFTVRRSVVLRARADRADLERLLRQYQLAVDPEALRWLAEKLGLSIESLRRLGIGWAADAGAWAFPMSDNQGGLRGIRLRSSNGRKWSATGSQQGLFIPTDLNLSQRLLICEGPTDTAAMLDLGFAAIGRPNCRGGTWHVKRFVKRCRPGKIVIVADGDEHGRNGAASLASSLVGYVRCVCTIAPPRGPKDARAWRVAGGTAADVQAAITSAESRCLETSRAQSEQVS